MSLDSLYSLRSKLEQSPLPPSSSRRASTAAIYRISPEPDTPSTAPGALSFFSQVLLKYPHLESGSLDLLFIKRAANPRDYHSSQIAFPGGKVDPGELPFAAAVRETQEEVGIDLTDPDFLYLGRTGERNVYRNRNRPKLMLSTYGSSYSVFVYVGTGTISVKLNEREVQDCAWVRFRTFTHEIYSKSY
jgi:8-oxo-dGTP pyrophosphatase MutT (NUDIX family)